MKYLLICFFILFNLQAFSQEEDGEEEYDPIEGNIPEPSVDDATLLANLADYHFFSDAVTQNIELYKINSNVAYEKKDLERADFLYDFLVNHCIKGSFFDNFLVNEVKSAKPVYFETFEKPIYLKTIATWCEPNESEAAAFNDIANEFGDLIDFVVLYWDPMYKVTPKVKDYDANVTVLYVDETENYNADIVNKVKHSFGLPSVFLMTNERKILNVKKGVAPKYLQNSLEYENRFGEFNTKVSQEHFVSSYGEYYDALAADVNELISSI